MSGLHFRLCGPGGDGAQAVEQNERAALPHLSRQGLEAHSGAEGRELLQPARRDGPVQDGFGNEAGKAHAVKSPDSSS